MKTILKAALIVSLFVTLHLQAQTQDIALSGNLLPNTQYQVTSDISTTAVNGLLALLGTSGSPLQILDQDGNVLGELPAQSLIDALTGATGTVTRQLSFLINSGTEPVTSLIVRILDSPLVDVGTPTFQAVGPSAPNQRPTVTLKKKVKSAMRLRLRGTAADDQTVQKVFVRDNGRNIRVKGTTAWRAKLTLREGRNRLTIQSIDNTGMTSTPKRVTVFAR